MNKLPAKIDIEQTFLLNETTKLYDVAIADKVRDRINNNWSLFVVHQGRGRCYYDSKIITIPVWAIKRGIEYATWYISHELAHSYAGYDAHHGKKFMQWLIRICPSYCIHLETTYKPKNAVSAGISHNQEINTLTKEDLF